jgi:riboflavin kinase/FMN adenylyltransferase
METLRDLASLGRLRGPVYLAIGVFDGVHRGHQALIEEARRDAARSAGTAVVMTFEPHPMMFFQREAAPLRLSGPRHKEILLERLGATHLAVLPFEGARAGQEAGDFVRELKAACRPLGGICVGAEWRFGRGRTGDLALLRHLGEAGDFEVDGIEAVRLGGEVISSSAIRHAIARGDLAFAEEALGRPYAVLGPVVRGRGLGRGLGFPTANIATHGLQLPPDGVYAVRVRADGLGESRAVANLGCRPTLGPGGDRVLEVHIPGHDGDLLGRELEVEFRRFLRAEQRFASIEDLKRQLARDASPENLF